MVAWSRFQALRMRRACCGSSRAPTPARTPARRGANTATCTNRLRTLPDLFRLSDGAVHGRRRNGPSGAHGRPCSSPAIILPRSASGPALGRFLRPDEVERAGGAPVVVISHSYWQTRFGGAATAIGRTLRVNERPLTIVGVTPERFQGTITMLTFDLWVPATMAARAVRGIARAGRSRCCATTNVAGRLAPRTTRAAAQAEVDVGDAAARARLPRVEPDDRGSGAGVLAGAARPAAVPHRRSRDSAGGDAAPAAGGPAATPRT